MPTTKQTNLGFEALRVLAVGGVDGALPPLVAPLHPRAATNGRGRVAAWL